ADAEELERGKRSARPATRHNRRQSVPGRPGILEGLRERALRPDLSVERFVPERVQTRAVAVVKPYGKGVDVHEWRGRLRRKPERSLQTLNAARGATVGVDARRYRRDRGEAFSSRSAQRVAACL